MLTVADPITWNPRRVTVAGITGAGKTTLAARIATSLGIPHTELDSLFHGPSWQPRPSFEADVARVISDDAWVIEWQYPATRAAIAARADTLVWLDLPFPVAFWRLLRRTTMRRVRHEVLWNGNREPPLWRVFVEHDHILRWALRGRRKLYSRIPPLLRELPELRIVRLRTARQVEQWMTALADRPGA